MFSWEQDPKRSERGIQMLLKRRYPGLRSFDGTGGDGGMDAALITTDGHTVFEAKSFGRLNSSRRRQVKRSLSNAVASAPDMTRWVLVIPMNMTPTRPGVKSSEQTWFYETLQETAPSVELDWFGLDWLDVEIAENMDVQRYIEGVDGQLLQRAKEFGMEQAVLADGSKDLTARLAALKRRVDEVSPFWTIDFGFRDGVQWQTLRAKCENAPLLDPITITQTMSFRIGDTEAERLRTKFESTLAFGGRIDLPAGYVSDIDVDASDEARLLFQFSDAGDSRVSIISTREQVDRRIRCSYEVLGGDGRTLAHFPVFLAERTSGTVGVTLYGSDPAGFAAVEVRLPRPTSDNQTAPSVLERGAGLDVSFGDSLVGFDVESLLPILGTLASAVPGNRIRFVLPGLGHVDSDPLLEARFPDAPAVLQLVADLHRMQEVNGSAYTFPANVTNGEVEELRRAVRQLDGEDVELEGGITLHVRRDQVAHFIEAIKSMPDTGEQGGFLIARDYVNVNVGDLPLTYGPSAFWAPHPRLTNLTYLEAVAAGHVETGADPDSVPAEFAPTDATFKWFSCEQSATYLATDERTS